jgi:5-methylcytosine-specific restriction endonuclease McrA
MSKLQTRGAKDMRARCKSLIASGELVICGICEKPIIRVDDLSLDHIQARAFGGRNYSYNLQPSHKDCNHRKGEDEFKRLKSLEGDGITISLKASKQPKIEGTL